MDTRTTVEQRGMHEDSARRIVTVRSMAIACALMPLLSLWVVQAELIWYTGHSTAISLFSHVTSTVFVIALVNLAVKRRWPRIALSAGELMTIYVMLCVSGTFCSHDMLQVIVPMLAYPVYTENPQNQWGTKILPYVKGWAICSDKTAVNELVAGNFSLYRLSVLKAWWKPVAFWSVFLLTLMTSMMCMMSIFRQAWTEKERLSFPVIQIPYMIAAKLTDLLRSKLFWTGFVAAAGIDILNGFHFLYPAVPELRVIGAFRFSDYFVERPWNAIGYTEVNLYPFVIGLAFLLPTDLAFSCWFFFVLFQLQLVVTSAIGLEELPGFPFPSNQGAGGYLAIALLSIWLARRHLVGVMRAALGLPGGIDESREALPYRAAVLGLFATFALMVAYGHALGARIDMMVVFFAIFYLYSLAIARMRAELGPPAHDLHYVGPDMLLTDTLGTSNLSKEHLGVFSLMFGFNRAYRAHFAPHCMEGFKLAQLTKTTARSMLVAIATAMVAGLASGWWAILHSLYKCGFSAGKPVPFWLGEGAWSRLDSWLTLPEGPRVGAMSALGLGALFTFFLGAMRMRFAWWVWHPVGYATCFSWSMGRLWACIFVAWTAKAIITRYGGAKAYQTALPLFVGMVLGEFMVGSFWCILGAIAKIPVYHFWG